MDKSELQNRFEYHKPDAEKVKKHETVRMIAGQFANWLNEELPEGREKSLAITKLEEAMFWSNAALARN